MPAQLLCRFNRKYYSKFGALALNAVRRYNAAMVVDNFFA